MANGFFRRKQANRLARILDDCRERGLCRIVMIHHPPVRGAAARHKRLFGIGRFQQIIRRHGAELVIHGHTHVPSHHEIAGDGRNVPVIGVSAGGQAPDGKHAPASFNLFDISRQDDRWRIALQRVTMTTLTGAFAVSARQHL
jgi:3',5'-cyclic AMP phosphodiesterase CpdA